ncbi:hypothetical protein C4572_01005 [Candidatus Parcubacteria bacterium]|nr:MAG: hypothetical protein C4572_01005 [Candidatus Parcubacteria bacterium]
MNGKIGIVGVGVVGGYRKTWFESEGYKRGRSLFLRDFRKGYYDKLTEPDLIFISVCPPAKNPRKSTFLLVRSVIKKLPCRKVIVINSTLGIGHTLKLQNEFKHHSLFFNPEFIWMPDGFKNTIEPERQIIAPAIKSEQTKEMAMQILRLLPKAIKFESPSDEVFLSSTEAEIVKLFTNFYISQQVDFSSLLYEVCQDMETYRKIMGTMLHDDRISPSHLINPIHGGYVGWGGHCLIKDAYQLKNSLEGKEKKRVIASLSYNKAVLKGQGITESEAALKKTSRHNGIKQKGGINSEQESDFRNNSSLGVG